MTSRWASSAIIFLFCPTSFCPAEEFPDFDSLLRDIRDHEKAAYALRESYTFHEVRRTVDKRESIDESEVFFANGYRIERLTKRDGAALSARENERELKRATKEALSRVKSARAKDQFAWAGDVLELMTIGNPRRALFRGRSTLVFDLSDKSGTPPHGSDKKSSRLFEGTIWIDESDRQMARLEVRFLDSLHLKGTGALLSLYQKGSTLAIDQSAIAGGLWMETAIDAKIGFRLLLKSFWLESHIRDTDFRRFDTNTMQTIQPPGERP